MFQRKSTYILVVYCHLFHRLGKLIQKYDHFSKTKVILYDSLVILLKNSVEKRFEQFLIDPFMFSIALLHPYLKNAWIDNDDRKYKIFIIFKGTVFGNI